jgi:hypothetical protein
MVSYGPKNSTVSFRVAFVFSVSTILNPLEGRDHGSIEIVVSAVAVSVVSYF